MLAHDGLRLGDEPRVGQRDRRAHSGFETGNLRLAGFHR
jgi:hypothetical protein